MVVIEIKNCAAYFHGFPFWNDGAEKKLVSFTTVNESLIISDEFNGSDKELILYISNPTKNAFALEYTEYACPNSYYIAFMQDEDNPNKFYQIPYDATETEFKELIKKIDRNKKV